MSIKKNILTKYKNEINELTKKGKTFGFILDDEIIAEISNMNVLFPVLTLYKFMSSENLKDILYVYNKIWYIIRR